MKDVHLIEVKFLGASTNRGARLKMKSLKFGDSITLGYNYGIGNIYKQAEIWLKKHKTTPLFIGETPNSYIIGVSTFLPLKEIKEGATK